MYHSYKPEGSLCGTSENREYLGSEAGLYKAMAQGKILEATVILCDADMNLVVDLCGIRGIIPREEVLFSPDERAQKDIAVITRVGKAVTFKILNIINENGETVAILSRRQAQIACIHNYIILLSPGDIIPCKVTHMEHFCAFVDIGCGIISMIPIDAISVSRISHPKDRFYIGMLLRAVVKSIDPENMRVFLTHKELLGTWTENASLYRIGETVKVVVRSIEDYGIFVELTPNLAGLAEFREGVTVGDCVAVYIKNIVSERMKVKLALVDLADFQEDGHKLHYFIGEDTVHIDRWRYSPEDCEKIIETVFE